MRPTLLLDLLAWLDAQDVIYPGNTANEVHRAGALAMLGRFAEARELMDAARERARDQGATIYYALITGQPAVDLELLADDPARAVELSGRAAACSRIKPKVPGCRRSWACRPSPSIVSACSTTPTPRPAEPATSGSSDDRLTQMLALQTRGKVHARRSDHAEAQRLAREAVAIGDQIDLLNYVGDAYADLAEVLVLADEPKEAVEAPPGPSITTRRRATSSLATAPSIDSPNSLRIRRQLRNLPHLTDGRHSHPQARLPHPEAPRRR